MTSETRISELTDIFKELADTAGGYERTRIMPNLEVIDASPSNLPANFLIIKDDEGYYIPALKVAGMTYTNGDLVNVLFIKGAEPIAFQHGSSGSGGYAVHISDEGVDQGDASTLDFVGAGVTAAVAAGVATIAVSAGGGGWPAAGKAMINNTEYDTVQLAIDAMSSGDIIKVGQGTDSGGIVPDTAGSIVGLSPIETIITRSDNSSITVSIDTPDNVTIKDMTISHTGAGVSDVCIQTNQDGIVLDGVIIEKTSGANTNSTGVSVYGGSGDGTYLKNCKIEITAGTNKYGMYTSTAASVVVIDGGEINAATADIYIGHASSVVELRGVKLLGGGINNASGGTVRGWYIDSGGVVRLVGDYQLFKTNFPTNDIWGNLNLSASDFVATIATLPGGATLTYNAPSSGDENNIVPYVTTQICKMVLHNITRSTEALISNSVPGTNTITLTANVPAGWQVGDTITMRSQTNTGNPFAGVYFCDLEFISDIDALCKSIVIIAYILDSGAANIQGILHPYETFNAIKQRPFRTQAAGSGLDYASTAIPLNSSRFCLAWQASGTGTLTLFLRLSEEGAAYQ